MKNLNLPILVKDCRIQNRLNHPIEFSFDYTGEILTIVLSRTSDPVGDVRPGEGIVLPGWGFPKELG